MARNQLAILRHHAGNGPAKLGHAGGDLRDLVITMHLGIAGIGAQPVYGPGFNLARRKDEVHGQLSSVGQGGQILTRSRDGWQLNWIPRCQENESAREAYPPAAIL